MLMNLPARMVVTALVAQRELDLLRDTLRSEGIEVAHVTSLKQAGEDPAPVIVLDADLCNPWTGSLRQLCLQSPDARIVLLSRLADNAMWVEALSAGAFDVVGKPCYSGDIYASILGALFSGPAKVA